MHISYSFPMLAHSHSHSLGLALGAASLSFETVCIACGALAACATLFAAAAPESASKVTASVESSNGASQVFASAAWRSVGLLQWCLGFTLGGVIFGLSAFVTQSRWGWSPPGTSAMFGVAVVAILLNTFFIYPLVLGKLGTYRLTFSFTFILAVLVVLMAVTEPSPAAYIPNFAAATLALTMTQPAALATAVELAESMSPSSKGDVLGWTRGLDELGRACGPMPLLALYGLSKPLGVVVPAVLLLVSGLVFFVACRPGGSGTDSGRVSRLPSSTGDYEMGA